MIQQDQRFIMNKCVKSRMYIPTTIEKTDRQTGSLTYTLCSYIHRILIYTHYIYRYAHLKWPRKLIPGMSTDMPISSTNGYILEGTL